MNPRALDVPPVALGRRVVDSQQQALARLDHLYRPAEKLGRDAFDIAAEAAQKVIIGFEVAAEPPAAQPTGDGFAPPGKQGADQQRQQPPRHTPMQHAGQRRDPRRQLRR